MADKIEEILESVGCHLSKKGDLIESYDPDLRGWSMPLCEYTTEENLRHRVSEAYYAVAQSFFEAAEKRLRPGGRDSKG